MRSRPLLLLALWLVVGTPAMSGPLEYGDPTQPTPLGRPVARATGGPVIARPRWELTSTLVSGDRRVAVINGRSASPGATIEGAKLLAVDAGGAWIEHQGRRIRLDLPRSAGRTITAKTPSGR